MKKIYMFAIVLAAAAMVSCAGNANKTAEAAGECTECVEGQPCTKPAEEQCAACKEAAAEQTIEGAVKEAATEAVEKVETAAKEAAVEAVNKAAEEVAKVVKGN